MTRFYTLLLCMGLSLHAFSQTNLWWVGDSSIDDAMEFSDAANWNTAANGTGTPTAPVAGDRLRFEGTTVTVNYWPTPTEFILQIRSNATVIIDTDVTVSNLNFTQAVADFRRLVQ